MTSKIDSFLFAFLPGYGELLSRHDKAVAESFVFEEDVEIETAVLAACADQLLHELKNGSARRVRIVINDDSVAGERGARRFGNALSTDWYFRIDAGVSCFYLYLTRKIT